MEYAKKAYRLGDVYEKYGLVGAGKIRHVYPFWNLYGDRRRLGGRSGSHTGGMDAFRKQIPLERYKQLAEGLTLEKFDAREYARLAKAAGMKYVCITAKHHDGFASMTVHTVIIMS